MTIWRVCLTSTASGQRWISRLAMVGLGVASVAAPAWAQAPDTFTEELGARLEQKLDAILGYAITAADEPRLTTLLEPEINAYFRFQGASEMPDGLTDPIIRILDDLQVTVDAVINLDAIREQRSRTWLDPLSYLGGRLPVFVSGTVSASNGAALVKIERITINRVPMPVQVLQELVGYFTRTADNPQGTQLDQPIPLPYGITELRQAPGRAVIVQ
ncbi:MAG TPA: hypothetical protein EYQ83_05900 [Acidobacteria bacterium]|nr:hypothetical protein [Acidobacteriota bacterium]